MADDPLNPTPVDTHTYVARPWYRDSTTLVGVVGLLGLILQDADFLTVIPESWHTAISKLVVVTVLILRYTSATRPVGLQGGEMRQVNAIAPRQK